MHRSLQLMGLVDRRAEDGAQAVAFRRSPALRDIQREVDLFAVGAAVLVLRDGSCGASSE
jgi:hypothetical protein